MAKKTKDARVQVILECTEHKASGMPGTSRYITTKNKKNTPERSLRSCMYRDLRFKFCRIFYHLYIQTKKHQSSKNCIFIFVNSC